jgi:hypothetical protein
MRLFWPKANQGRQPPPKSVAGEMDKPPSAITRYRRTAARNYVESPIRYFERRLNPSAFSTLLTTSHADENFVS